MATVVSITNPITGAVEQVDKLDHTAQQIDDAVALAPQISNPNLLDNWYFGNPVNQRGQTEYSAVGYTIDRWKAIANAFSTTSTDEGISISGKQFQYILQNIENPERLNGKTVTISALIKNPDGAVRINLHNQTTDVGLFKDFPASNGFTLVQYTTTPSISKGDIAFAGIYPGANNATDPRSCVVQAVKLELGSQQTLAHQDENGNWVLNEIPDYGEQLARCQRYFQLYSSADLRPAKAVDCRPTMRANPSQGTIVIDGTTYYYNTADL